MSQTLQGRSAIITGASRGLGQEIARHYITEGASVLICARDADALQHVADELHSLAASGQIIASEHADVSNADDVERIVRSAIERFGKLDILVNNAGIYGPMGTLETVDWEAWVRALEINLYGSALMFRAVLPHFKQRRYGKIIQLSGGGATNPLPGISAYAASKAAVVRLAETLAEEVREFRIDVNAIAPGSLNTRLLDEVIEAGPERVGKRFYERSLQQKLEGGAPLHKGADLAVFLGSAASDGITGKLLSALWDLWPSLPEHAEELKQSDIYTLRRITPKDRGAKWGE